MLTTYHERLRLGEDEARRHPEHARGVAPAPSSSRRATTIIGFASLAITDITMVVQFGVGLRRSASPRTSSSRCVRSRSSCASGPCLGTAPAVRRRGRPEEGRIAGGWMRLARFNLRYRVPILVATAAVDGDLAGRRCRRLRVNTDLVTFFPREARGSASGSTTCSGRSPGRSPSTSSSTPAAPTGSRTPTRAPEHRGHAGLPAPGPARSTRRCPSPTTFAGCTGR